MVVPDKQSASFSSRICPAGDGPTSTISRTDASGTSLRSSHCRCGDSCHCESTSRPRFSRNSSNRGVDWELCSCIRGGTIARTWGGSGVLLQHCSSRIIRCGSAEGLVGEAAIARAAGIIHFVMQALRECAERGCGNYDPVRI